MHRDSGKVAKLTHLRAQVQQGLSPADVVKVALRICPLRLVQPAAQVVFQLDHLAKVFVRRGNIAAEAFPLSA